MNALDRLRRLRWDNWSDIRGHLKYIIHLLAGNVMANALALVSLAIAARALSPADFGLLVMIVTYVRLVERLIRFESWQPLIHFASKLEGGEAHRLQRLYLFGLILDISAAVLATVVAIGLAYLFSEPLGIPATALGLVTIYSFSVLFNLTGVPTASMRLARQFRTMAYVQPVAQIVRMPLALLCWFYSPTLTSFTYVWLIAQVIGSAIMVVLGWRALHAQAIPNPFKASPRGLLQEFPGFINFAWSSNLSMSMRTITQEADVLLVGFLAGPGSAGFYHVAKRIAKIAMQVGAHTQAVLYPEMARMWSTANFAALRSLTLRVQTVLFSIGFGALIAAALFGQFFVDLALGKRYGEVGPLLVAQLVAVTLMLHSAPSRSVLLSMGKPHTVLVITLIGTVLFFASAMVLIPQMGAMGASISQILLAGSTAGLMLIAWMRSLRGEMTRNPDASPISLREAPGD